MPMPLPKTIYRCMRKQKVYSKSKTRFPISPAPYPPVRALNSTSKTNFSFVVEVHCRTLTSPSALSVFSPSPSLSLFCPLALSLLLLLIFLFFYYCCCLSAGAFIACDDDDDNVEMFAFSFLFSEAKVSLTGQASHFDLVTLVVTEHREKLVLIWELFHCKGKPWTQ